MGYRWKYARGLRGVGTSSEDARTTDAGATAASDAAPSNAERRDVDDDVLGASRSLSFDGSDAVARGRMDRDPRSSRARETDRDAPMRTVGARPASDDMCIVARHTDRARDALLDCLESSLWRGPMHAEFRAESRRSGSWRSRASAKSANWKSAPKISQS